MKKIIVWAIAALLLTSISTAYAAPHEPDDPQKVPTVKVCFQSGIGITMRVTNTNEDTVYEVTLDTDVVQITGGPLTVATMPGKTTVEEIAPGESAMLSMFSFGVPGVYTVTATITFEINEQAVTQTVHGTVLMFGFVTVPV